MPDISMCRDQECPSRETCFRFVATPSPFLQTYGAFGRRPNEAKCDHYWPATTAEARKLSRAHEA